MRETEREKERERERGSEERREGGRERAIKREREIVNSSPTETSVLICEQRTGEMRGRHRLQGAAPDRYD